MDVALRLVRDNFSGTPLYPPLAVSSDAVQGGASLCEALAQRPFFPPTFLFFLRGAQGHGELPETLSRLAEHYETQGQVRGAQVRLTIYLLAMLGVGTCVLALIVACYGPIFQIQEALGGRPHVIRKK